MTRPPLLAATLMFALTTALGPATYAEDAPTAEPTHGRAPQMAPQMAEMMQKCMEMATPGAPHALLARKAGTWDYHATMWCPAAGADAPPMKTTGTTELKTILDGRFLLEHATGQDPDQPFEGMGISGYDNVTKKFVSVWVDTMGTGIMTAEGAASPDGRVLTYTATYPDPVTGTVKTAKTVESMRDDDHWTMQMFEAGPDGADALVFQIEYTRRP